MVNSVEELDIINELIGDLNLNNLITIRGGFNFSCPLCLEGKSPHKRRGYILFDDGTYGYNSFVCHNCYPDGMYFRTLVKNIGGAAWEKYKKIEKSKRLVDFKKSKKFFDKKPSRINKKTIITKPQYLFELSPESFTPLKNVTKALDYAKSRKIPEHIIDTLYFSRARKNWTYGNMLIFPLTFNDKTVYGFQGRSIDSKIFRTFTKNDAFKVYGVFNVDKAKTVYCFESIIDSFSIKNSIAMLGSSLSKPVQGMFSDLVFCFDNDRTGVEKSIKYLENKQKVFLWPNQIKAKDTNELLVNGITQDQIQHMIEKNVYEGVIGLGKAAILLNKFKRTFIRRK